MRKVSKSSISEACLRWGPAVALMGAIYTASATPASKIPSFYEVDEPVKKLGHALGYGMLALSFLRGIGSQSQHAKEKAILFSILYAISDELHQRKTAGRTPSWLDVGIDTFGAVSAIFLYKQSEFLRSITDCNLKSTQ